MASVQPSLPAFPVHSSKASDSLSLGCVPCSGTLEQRRCEVSRSSYMQIFSNQYRTGPLYPGFHIHGFNKPWLGVCMCRGLTDIIQWIFYWWWGGALLYPTLFKGQLYFFLVIPEVSVLIIVMGLFLQRGYGLLCPSSVVLGSSRPSGSALAGPCSSPSAPTAIEPSVTIPSCCGVLCLHCVAF